MAPPSPYHRTLVDRIYIIGRWAGSIPEIDWRNLRHFAFSLTCPLPGSSSYMRNEPWIARA